MQMRYSSPWNLVISFSPWRSPTRWSCLRLMSRCHHWWSGPPWICWKCSTVSSFVMDSSWQSPLGENNLAEITYQRGIHDTCPHFTNCIPRWQLIVHIIIFIFLWKVENFNTLASPNKAKKGGERDPRQIGRSFVVNTHQKCYANQSII